MTLWPLLSLAAALWLGLLCLLFAITRSTTTPEEGTHV